MKFTKTPSRPAWAFIATLLAAGVILVSTARRGATQAPPALVTAGEIQPLSTLENTQPVNNGYPAMVSDGRGGLWCAFLSQRLENPQRAYTVATYREGDAVVVRARKGGQWLDPVVLNTNFGVNLEPAIAADRAGNIHVVWASRRHGAFTLYARRVGQDLSMGSEIQVAAPGALNGHPSLAADRDGKLWLAAETYRNGSMDIAFYVLEGSGWRRMPDIAATPDPEFRPRLAAAPDGSLWCAWDADSQGKYRVMLRRFDPAAGSWGEPETVPGDGKLDAYAPDLAVDASGRVWVTYARNECEDADWGLRGPKPGAPPRPTVRLVVRGPAGWEYPRAGGNAPGFVARGDLPRITAAPDGALWLAWQFLPGHVNGKVGAIVCQRGAWSPARIFGEDEMTPVEPRRRYDQRPSIVSAGPGSLLIAYERGRGVFRDRDIYLREIRAEHMTTGAADPPLDRFPSDELRPAARPVVRHAPRQPVHEGASGRWKLYFGDLHNHLLIDDGHMGSVDQLFMFHRDRFGMDFAATTSHGDSNKLLLSELAMNDALTEAMLATGQFVTIPGFEWTQGDFVVPRAGHRSVVYETSGGPLYRPTEGYSDSIREFVDLMSKTNGLIFAHHVTRAFTGGTDWSYVNVKIEPVVEMCSSWGRFEYFQNPGHIRVPELKGCSVQDAWRMGWRLGVVGGSDGHDLYGARIQGLTGVYAAELTRPALFEALRKRRCYATTGEPIVVDFRVNGHLMGAEITSADGPLVEASVAGTAPLIAVEVVKFEGGNAPFRTVYRAPVAGNQSKVWWKDAEFRASAMYYLRVTQQAASALAAKYDQAKDNPFPTEMAWSSPVWVNKQ